MNLQQFQIGDYATVKLICCHPRDFFRRHISTYPGRIIAVAGETNITVTLEWEMVHIRDGGTWIPLVYKLSPGCLVKWRS